MVRLTSVASSDFDPAVLPGYENHATLRIKGSGNHEEFAAIHDDDGTSNFYNVATDPVPSPTARRRVTKASATASPLPAWAYPPAPLRQALLAVHDEIMLSREFREDMARLTGDENAPNV